MKAATRIMYQRLEALKLAGEHTYAANNLNQYTGITRGEETPFVPTYDANGNQTLVKTATGLWTVQYDANNRPVSFTKTEGETTTVVECGYDYLGRRYMKKVTVNGTVTLRHRYLYRSYLQIACCDLTRAAHPCLWLITWDPTEPVATRPLAIQKDGTWYCYGLDITKNVWELFGSSGYIRTAYDYTPYGSVTAEGNASQPVQWSSEVYDEELALVYYNYRHYNPMDGRWINRDPIAEQGGWNLYAFVGNRLFISYDRLGEFSEKKIREIITIYENIIAKGFALGYNQAAQNLRFFLAGALKNRKDLLYINMVWLRSYYPVTSAEEKNQERFEDEIESIAKRMKDKDRKKIANFWDAGITANIHTDLYYASGGSTLTSQGYFELERKGCKIYITGTVQHYWYDKYDWHAGLGAFIPLPGIGVVPDDYGLILVQAGRAKEFDMQSFWKTSYKGVYDIGIIYDSFDSSDWSEPQEGGEKPKYEKYSR